jgi:hypothetical protein
MNMPRERFKILNLYPHKKIENIDYRRPLRIRVDCCPEIVVYPGMVAEIPEGAVIEIVADEVTL